MDDDLTFGASVWGTGKVDILPLKPTPLIVPASSKYKYDEDPFDDFDEPVATGSAEDEDFGDFGDFDEVTPMKFEDDVKLEGKAQIAGPSSHSEWHPLKLDPWPSQSDLEEQVNRILGPVWGGYEDLSIATTSEEIRDVEGISQVLVTPESRNLYKALIQSTPPTKPLNWTRSRIRRQHLIALGIPVNLDEVLPRANGKPLPPLQITTRPMSAPPGPRNFVPPNNIPLTSSNNSRAGTPQLPNHYPAPPSHFGPKPELDFAKIEKLLELDPDTLTIQPRSTLERHLADLKAQTISTSALLTHLLQTRESLQQDNETYNGLIADLVGEAQKMKSGKPRMASSTRRGSGMN